MGIGWKSILKEETHYYLREEALINYPSIKEFSLTFNSLGGDLVKISVKIILNLPLLFKRIQPVVLIANDRFSKIIYLAIYLLDGIQLLLSRLQFICSAFLAFQDCFLIYISQKFILFISLWFYFQICFNSFYQHFLYLSCFQYEYHSKELA